MRMSAKVKKAAAPKKKINGYKMPAPIALGEVINDTLSKKKWRIGPSIGVGGFGEIYSACEHTSSPKKGGNYPFVIKIEPHENGPLFVEMHFYIKNANKADIASFMKDKKLSTFGMPLFYGNGSHEYKGEKYRYLVLERYGQNIWNLFLQAGKIFPTTTVFLLGLQMLDVLEYIHNKGYVHADIKGANILMGLKKGTQNQAYLVDFGLASRVNEKEFKPDPKCAHNGTIEYTSRDAHLGVPTMRGDLEILGYNMVHWIVGELPWEKCLKQPKSVQAMKESFMKNVRGEISKLSTNVPEALIKFFEYINSLKPKDNIDYVKCKQIFEGYLKSEGASRSSKLEFTNKKRKTNKPTANDDDDELDSDNVETERKVLKKNIGKENEDNKTTKRGRKAKAIVQDENSENEEPEIINNVTTNKRGKKTKAVANKESDHESEESIRKIPVKSKKRKSSEPSVVVKVKKTKMAPKATPPLKRNHVNTATQTSIESKRNPRQVSFDSPISAVIGEQTSKNEKDKSANSSGDIFEDSFVIEDKKVKPKRKLLSEEEVTVKRVIRKKVTRVKPKVKSWKDISTIVNGRSPPK